MTLNEILPELQKWFAPDRHQPRKLKGGGQWWFVPHQLVVDRLNKVCPNDWHEDYVLSHREEGGDPIYLCRLTICGVTRVGIGDKSNEPSNYGTPAQRAFRKAFMDAAEKFGIAAYLDDQKDDRTKRSFAQYMAERGDLRPAQEYKRQNGQVALARRSDPAPKPFGQSSVSPARSTAPNTPTLITENERQDLWAIAQSTGYDAPAFKCLVEACGFKSSAAITKAALPEIFDRAKDVESLRIYQEAAKVAG